MEEGDTDFCDIKLLLISIIYLPMCIYIPTYYKLDHKYWFSHIYSNKYKYSFSICNR